MNDICHRCREYRRSRPGAFRDYTEGRHWWKDRGEQSKPSLLTGFRGEDGEAKKSDVIKLFVAAHLRERPAPDHIVTGTFEWISHPHACGSRFAACQPNSD
jgi:hypothetical protein